MVHDPRRFAPPSHLVARANVTPDSSATFPSDPQVFWEQQAHRIPWREVHTWVPPDPADPTTPRATWFTGGRLNAAEVCVDQHVAAGRGQHAALLFEGDVDGYVRVQGRVDDVVKVSGHRLSTIEIGSALVEHPLSPRPARWASTTP